MFRPDSDDGFLDPIRELRRAANVYFCTFGEECIDEFGFLKEDSIPGSVSPVFSPVAGSNQ